MRRKVRGSGASFFWPRQSRSGFFLLLLGFLDNFAKTGKRARKQGRRPRNRGPRAKGVLVANPRTPPAEVFLNIPYDFKFRKLFLAYISGISALGLVPRATLELASSARRLERIVDLIKECRYSLHDLSRVEPDRQAPSTPRFNMPFELGLAGAYEQTAHRGHEWFVFEAMNRRLLKSLSDLNGTDPYIHNGTIAGVFRELRNIFLRPRRQPSTVQMWDIYRDVRGKLPRIFRAAGGHSLYTARVFRDFCVIASDSADRIVL
jgi:hypothetical protein